MAVFASDILPDTSGRNLGNASQRFNAFLQNLNLDSGVKVMTGQGDPSAGAGTNAPQGSLFLRTDGTGSTSVYVKSGAGDTDWTVVITGSTVTATLVGNLTGDVTGNVTGSLTGNVTGDVTGNLTGNVTGNASTVSATPITNDATTNATMYPVWVTTASGNQVLKVASTKLSFNPSTGMLTVTGITSALTGNVTGNVTGNADTATLAKGNQNTQTVASGDGAIAILTGTLVITKGSACVLTLAAPAAGTDDGKVLTILSTTGYAHTVTQTTPGFNNAGGGGDVATFGAAAGNCLVVEAYNGKWFTRSTIGITLG